MRFSDHSLSLLYTCHPDLVRLMTEAIADPACPHDFSIECGARSIAQEAEDIRTGASRLRDPNDCYHCHHPSDAVDIAPWPVDWTPAGEPAFYALADNILAVASRLGIQVTSFALKYRWDLGHYQRVITPAPPSP